MVLLARDFWKFVTFHVDPLELMGFAMVDMHLKARTYVQLHFVKFELHNGGDLVHVFLSAQDVSPSLLLTTPILIL
jgi:hypothetical protein